MYSRLIPLRTDNVDNVSASDVNTLEDFLRGLANGDYDFSTLKIADDSTDYVTELPILKAFYDAKGTAEGPVVTDSNNKIPTSQLPALATTETYPVNSEASQLALTVQAGDFCVRTDLEQSYIALNDDNASMGDWQLLQSPTDAVQSVDGKTGTVVLSNDYEPKNSNIQTHINDNDKHRIINDSGTSSTELWSASKIESEITGSLSIDDTPIDGATTKAISSNWAYDQSQKFRERARLTEQAGGFWGEVVQRKSTSITIRQKRKNGQCFIGMIMGNGEYVENTVNQSITIYLDTSTLDGIGAVQNNSWYILYGYKKSSDGTLGFDFSFMPSTTLSSANPTNTLTLSSINGKNTPSLFPLNGEVSLFESSSKFETPIYDTTVGYNGTKVTCKVIGYSGVTGLQLNGTLGVTNFTTSTEVYLTSGYKPIDCNTGAINTAISGDFWGDSGIRVMTDSSGNVRNFMIDDEEIFYFTDGTGSADANDATLTGSFLVSNVWQNYRQTFCPPDKSIRLVMRAGNYVVYTRPYWETYGEGVYGIATTSRLPMSFNKSRHGLFSARGSTALRFGVVGYKI